MTKAIIAILMVAWGIAEQVIPGFNSTAGVVWVVGGILLAWMPERGDK